MNLVKPYLAIYGGRFVTYELRDLLLLYSDVVAMLTPLSLIYTTS